MLQRNMQRIDETYAPLGSATVEGDGFGEIIHRALAFLRRRYLIIILIAALAMAACIVYLRITPPTYTARVEILFSNSRAEFLQKQSLLPDPVVDASQSASQIATQLQLIKSRATAVRVINELKLADDPDLNVSGPSLSSLGRLISSASKDPQFDAAGQPSERVIAAFEDRLTAIRASSSNVIEVGFSSSSPIRAAEVANAVANAYIADQLDVKFEVNRSAKDWLQGRLHDLGKQALAAERAVNAYKSQNNIVSSGGKPIDELQITELNNRLAAARVQISDAAARASRYEVMLHANSDDSSSLGTLDAGPDSLTSPIINNLRLQYLELARRANEWAAKFGRDHQAVMLLRTKMAELRTSISEEVKRLAEASRSELEVAKQRQQQIEKQLNEVVSQSRSTSSAELTIRELESHAKESRTLYDSLLQRYMGSLDNFPLSEARVIAPALPPQTKSKPKTVLVLAIGALGSLALGVGLGLLRDRMERVFRTSGQIEGKLELPCLSIVPRLSGPKPPQPAAASSRADDDSRLIASPPSAVHDVAVNMPSSRYAEALRSIKLAIDLSPGKGSNQIIGITSALPNEGKTTIASSLAQLIGHTGKKIIIVDCDLRNPSLTTCLAPNATTGIVEVINGNRSLEETVWRDPKTGLVFLPAVRRKPLFHSSEILSAEATRNLFNQLRTSYDYVIVDLPPLTPLVDVRVTAPLIDFFILVVEWGRTKIDVAQHALHTAPNVYENLIGVVLNKTDIKSMLRYDAQHSDYYSDTHYIRYGLTDPT
ncbi:AAA family ATPase [Bradyrhizobium canariense]|uniref:non-specific protein-tyrosine kinase n=1 Tax=Bradyrhizobium canariense TaxID=255045 RepID=A0A1H1WQ16_9BRAD|nr:AAA family ATPase [Bradyrhizobium canariense]SDS99408.1 exopolysaccharide transport protein family [Bradyrhizobium canariense]